MGKLGEPDINNQILYVLKGHAIDILTRRAPEKRGYYKLVWEKMDFKMLTEYKLDGVYKTREDE